MSVRTDAQGEKLVATQSLTVGSGDFSMGIWFYLITDRNTTGPIACLGDLEPDPTEYLNMRISGAGEAVRGTFSADGADLWTNVHTMTTATWYYLVISRSGTTARFRAFDDTTSTTPIVSHTQTDATSYTTLDTIIVGEFNANEWADGEFACLKVHTGVAWSDAECRTESQNLDLVKSGGTDRYVWRLENTDADTDGINEAGGSGPNFTNTNVTNGSSRPSQLESAITTYQDAGTDGQKLSDSSSIIVRPSPSTCRIVSVL